MCVWCMSLSQHALPKYEHRCAPMGVYHAGTSRRHITVPLTVNEHLLCAQHCKLKNMDLAPAQGVTSRALVILFTADLVFVHLLPLAFSSKRVGMSFLVTACPQCLELGMAHARCLVDRST